MSTAVAQPRPRIVIAGRQAEPRSRRAWRLPALSILAFAMLALLAGQRFEALIAHPSFFRDAGVIAVAGGLAAGLLASAALPASDSATLLRMIGSVLALYLAMRIAGIAATRLAPWHWGSLVRGLSGGTSHLDGRWPYRGSSLQTRIAIQACVPATVLPAAALVFWPGQAGTSRRRLAALSLLLTLYVTAAANEPRTGWQVQGLIALLALYLWAWSSRTRRAEDGRATAWLLAGAVLSLPLAAALAAKPLIDVKAWQPFGVPGATTSFNWNQTYGPLPWSTSTASMAEVDSRSPHLWRAAVLDRFDGTRFLASGHPPLEPSGAATEPGNRRWIATSTFTVHALAGRELLSPGQILAAKIEGSSPIQLANPATDGTVTADKTLPGGTSYTVTAYAPRPTVREMRQAHPIRSDGLRPYVSFELPSRAGLPRPTSSATVAGRARIEASPYASVYRLARRLEAGRTDTYDVATHIQFFLRTRFTYDTQTPRTRYPIVTFLLSERRGYCQQFSAAMTLMLRMDGIPARVASGFLPGSRDSGKSAFTLRGPDAHAWVEVFFTGIGWVPFDPTPSQTLSIPKGGRGSELSAGQLAAASKAKPGRPKAGLTPRSAGRTPSGGGSEWWWFAGAVGLLAMAASGLWRARSAHRRARWDDGERAIEELVRALSRLGLAPAPGTTLSELERRLAGSHGAEAASYLRALRTLRYTPSSTAPPPSAKERRRLRQALTAGRGPLSRIRALRALPPRFRLG
jgi:transglutaminase-like putative cysteine protease